MATLVLSEVEPATGRGAVAGPTAEFAAISGLVTDPASMRFVAQLATTGDGLALAVAAGVYTAVLICCESSPLPPE